MPSNVEKANILNGSIQQTCGNSVNTMSQIIGLTTEEARFDFSYVCVISSSPKCPEWQ